MFSQISFCHADLTAPKQDTVLDAEGLQTFLRVGASEPCKVQVEPHAGSRPCKVQIEPMQGPH